MVRFGAVTSEKRLFIFVLVRRKLQKLAYSADYLILTKLLALIDMWVGMINLTFVLRSLKGRCYSNQFILGLFASKNWPPLVYALAFWNGMQYCHLHRGINTGDDAAISCKYLVGLNFVYYLCTFVRLLGENWPTISICCAGFSKHVGRWKCRLAHFKQWWTCTCHKFGGLLTSSSAVNEAQLCRAGIDQHLG